MLPAHYRQVSDRLTEPRSLGTVCANSLNSARKPSSVETTANTAVARGQYWFSLPTRIPTSRPAARSNVAPSVR